MVFFQVTGMRCSVCASHVEKAITAISGVESCEVNFITGEVSVDGIFVSEEVVRAVKKAGYGIKKKKKTYLFSSSQERSLSLIKLFISIGLLLVLMYLSMGVVMWNWPIFSVFREHSIIVALAEFVLALTIMSLHYVYFVQGFKAALRFKPTMDTLIALGSSVSFLWSSFLLVQWYSASSVSLPVQSLSSLSFETSAMIVTFISVGKLLEERAKGKTTDALQSLLHLSPIEACVIHEGKQTLVRVEEVKVGDLFLVKPGENIPLDGIIESGFSFVNESLLTGESIPVEKDVGKKVMAGTTNGQGVLTCRVTAKQSDTMLSKIIRLVSEASSSKAPIARMADKVASYFVPSVCCISLMTFAIWLLSGAGISISVEKAVAVLVISCPCSLGLATPVAIMAGTGIGAQKGILFKNATALERVAKTTTIVFDKTGTVTSGESVVIEQDIPNENDLKFMIALEMNSEHPIAKAIRRYGVEKEIAGLSIQKLEVVPGKGLRGIVDNQEIRGGSLSWISEIVSIPEESQRRANKWALEGKTICAFAQDGRYLGILAISDAIRDESITVVHSLNKKGKRTILLSGDRKETSEYVGKTIGVSKVISEVLPSEKAGVIQDFQKQGQRVCMIGDGINDAPALTVADVGIAISSGTDIAMESASIVLSSGKIEDVLTAMDLSHDVIKTIKENLFWAALYNCIGIPLATGFLGMSIPPMFASVAMSLSSIGVVSNALRLKSKKKWRTKE